MHSPQQTILIKEPPAVAHNFCPDPDSCGLLQQALSQKAEIEAENEKLRQIFTLAQNEFEKRNKRIEYLLQEISFLREIERENKNLKQQLEQALAKANLFSRMLYGRKTEKGQSGQTESASITPESNESRQEQDYGNEKKKTRGATPGHKGYGRKIPDNLPVREQIIDIPEDKKKCDCCGEALIEQPELDQISFEISSEKIYYIKKIVRKAYTKACDCPETRAIVVAIPPPKIIPKGKFSIEFWAECLLNKYMMHLPVQRQLLDMKLNNLLSFCRHNLWQF